MIRFPLGVRVVVISAGGPESHGTIGMVDTSYFRHRYGLYLDDGTEGMVDEFDLELENPLLALAEAAGAEIS